MQNINEEIKYGKIFREAPLDEEIVRKILAPIRIKPGEKVLDAGCGEGYWGKIFAKKFEAGVLGVDINRILLKRAKKKALNSQRFLRGDLKDLKLKEKFSVVVCGGVLHHFPERVELKKVLVRMSSHLKRGGLLLIVEPNGSNPIVKLSNFLARYLRARNVYISSPNETWHSAKTHQKILKEIGFSKIEKRAFYVNEPASITTKKIGNFFFWLMMKIRAYLYSLLHLFFPFWYRSGTLLVIWARQNN